MSAEHASRQHGQPRASRPWMPYYGMEPADKGKGLLPWSYARERLEKSHNYLLSTTRPDGSPHLAPIWGLWFEEKFYFSTGRQSRKGRNLAANPRCVVSTDRINDVVIVEGVAEEVPVPSIPQPLFDLYPAKYPPWKLDPSLGPVFVVRPRVVFAFPEPDFTTASTRWHFDP
jgi:nitroimidazol reductase NimA-like FMN-containing flavoprotein (pyridoxamine 5'-phosphate oxidase superfamily)